MMCHRDLLLRLHQHLTALRQARKLYAPKLAPEFNAIGMFGPDELHLSQILKELLSPKDLLSPSGSHAQGAIFLELFLKRFELDNFLPSADRANVTTEKKTNLIANTMRSMDIHLDFTSAAIAIENKPWAGDQENQCRDYLAQLALSHPQFNCLIYLSGSGEPPSDYSIKKCKRKKAEDAGRFKTIGYPQLIDWLKDCRRECQADRVSFFLNEFIDYIQKQFVGIEMTEMQEVVNIAMNNGPEVLQAALELVHAQDAIRQRLLARLKQQLENKFNVRLWTLKWHDVQRTNNYRFFSVSFFQNQQYSVGFSFEKKDYSGLVYGIVKNYGPHLHDLLDVRDCLNQIPFNALESSNKTSVYWPWYREFISSYGDWSRHIEPWIDIVGEEEKMADMIMEKTQAIYTALVNANLLDQLGGIAAPPQN